MKKIKNKHSLLKHYKIMNLSNLSIVKYTNTALAYVLCSFKDLHYGYCLEYCIKEIWFKGIVERTLYFNRWYYGVIALKVSSFVNIYKYVLEKMLQY